MARREQTGTGGARRGQSNGATGAGQTRKRRNGRKPRATHQTARHAQQAKPASRTATPGAAHPAGGSAWHSVTGAASLSPLRGLAADQALPEVALTLVGAEQATLGAALHAWGAARDLAANRAWRRPGGLTRMASL